MISDFHKAFGDKFRGSREEIKTRSQVYLPLIEHLKHAYPDVSIVDLGCGRGEWLETLKENGFSALGVDLEEGVLAECRELGLSVQNAEALSFLKNLPDESQAVISSLHMAEHLSFENLKALVREALRVLRPAGLLILETPNPENIIVGSSSFYMDPTHQKPIPPHLLTFLPEYYGFKRVRILRLQGASTVTKTDEINLLNVLNGVSPDYAVVAQKQPDNESLYLDERFFSSEPGLTLEFLAASYEKQRQRQTRQLNTLQADVDRIKKRLDEGNTELQAIYNSRFWRLTWPLRKLTDSLKQLYHGLLQTKLRIIHLPKSSGRWLHKSHQPAVLPLQISWRLEGPFDSSYSLALLNRETALALEALGHQVSLHSTEGPGDFSPNTDFLRAHPELAKMYERSKEITQEKADIVSRNLFPPRVSDMGGNQNLVHNFAWEETAFPRDWVKNFNDHLQGVTCLSRHVLKIMVDNGVTVPLSISGCGVDHWERIKPDTSYPSPGREFRFLHVSSCFPRKGVDVLLKAYGTAFSADDPVTLIIKTFKNPHNETHRLLSEARAEKTGYPDVSIIEEDLTEGKLKALYQQCHALVAPSRAEGFGLPLAEAMLSGLPVITTAWGGQLSFCSDETAWLVEYRFEPADTHLGLYDSVWAEPDLNCLAHKMRNIYEMPPNERSRKPAAGRRLLLENYCWSKVTKRLVNSAHKWSYSPEPMDMRIGWITPWNTRCGVATYSEALIKNVPGQTTVLAPKTSLLTAKDGSNVKRCWEAGEHDSLALLDKTIKESGFNTIVIQFNYGFFNLENLRVFLEEQAASGRVVVVMMHSTTDPSHVPHMKLSVLAPSLARCHRVLVHSINDLNRLKDHGLVENVSLFPHGVPDFQASPVKKETSAAFKISSYGFALPPKGLLELIDAVSLLRKRSVNVSLSMINAEYPTESSKSLVGKAIARIKFHHLEQWIDICTDFLPDEESLRRLNQTDLLVFPYLHSVESSSGAVHTGLAAGVPVAVTPLAIFDDVKQAVHFLPGHTAHEIAEGIEILVRDSASGKEYIHEKKREAETWRDAHLYSQAGINLHGILTGLNNPSSNPDLP